jgi:hypothetical protein
MRLWFSIVLVIIVSVASGCARQPSEKTIARVAKGYFKSYGRKYKTSKFGLSKVQSVKVEDTEEVHQGMVQSTMTLSNRDGTSAHVLCMIERNDPFGWRIISWENLY